MHYACTRRLELADKISGLKKTHLALTEAKNTCHKNSERNRKRIRVIQEKTQST